MNLSIHHSDNVHTLFNFQCPLRFPGLMSRLTERIDHSSAEVYYIMPTSDLSTTFDSIRASNFCTSACLAFIQSLLAVDIQFSMMRNLCQTPYSVMTIFAIYADQIIHLLVRLYRLHWPHCTADS